MVDDLPRLDPARDRIIDLRLDEASIARGNRDIDQEREIAIFDLLDENVFGLLDHDRGPYRLLLGISEERLVFDISDEAESAVAAHMLSLSPFKRIVKDYFLVCESYFEAIKTAPPSRIEAIDMGRRGLHNEGSTLLLKRLEGKVRTDFDTARRLFTLICALHWKG